MTLADLRRENPELFPQELCAWAERYEFFTNEYAGGDSFQWRETTTDQKESEDAPKAIAVAMIMVEAIHRKDDCELLRRTYFRTASTISSRAIVVLRCTEDSKIQIESWDKDSRHRLLSDWHWPLQGSH
jgi:hypothetical protein